MERAVLRVHQELAEVQVHQENQEVVEHLDLQEHLDQVVHQELAEVQVRPVHLVLHLLGKVTGIVELLTKSMMLFITMEVLIFL